MGSMAKLFDRYSRLFDKKGWNDDGQMDLFKRHPNALKLVATSSGYDTLWRWALTRDRYNPHGYLRDAMMSVKDFEKHFVNTGFQTMIASIDPEGWIYPAGDTVGPWFEDEELTRMPEWFRPLTNEEQADLPDEADGPDPWHNFSEDPAKYYVSYGRAYYVPADFWRECKDAGIMCIHTKGVGDDGRTNWIIAL